MGCGCNDGNGLSNDGIPTPVPKEKTEKFDAYSEYNSRCAKVTDVKNYQTEDWKKAGLFGIIGLALGYVVSEYVL